MRQTDTSDVKIVRVLFSDFNDFDHIREVPDRPMFDEIVYVCGLENQAELHRRGYDTYLMDEKPGGKASNSFNKFYNKLEALNLACQHYERFIMLDWDANPIKPLDRRFFSKLENKKLMIPTYSYPNQLQRIEGLHEWFSEMIPRLNQYSWSLDEFRILPNACFIYVNGMPNLGKELLDIANQYNLLTNVEEFAFYIWANSTLDEFILNYEPFCIFGRPDDNQFTIGNFSMKCEHNLHSRINTLITKDIYFKHQ